MLRKTRKLEKQLKEEKALRAKEMAASSGRYLEGVNDGINLEKISNVNRNSQCFQQGMMAGFLVALLALGAVIYLETSNG